MKELILLLLATMIIIACGDSGPNKAPDEFADTSENILTTDTTHTDSTYVDAISN